MGGSGSGRHGYRSTVEDSLTLSVFFLQRNGVLTGGWRNLSWWRNDEKTSEIGVQGEGGTLLLSYTKTLGGEKHSIQDMVCLETTPAYFGGERYWFKCPRCDKRRGKLHLPGGALHFLCRECHTLTYTSSNESGKYGRLFRLIAADSGMSPKGLRRGFKRILSG